MLITKVLSVFIYPLGFFFVLVAIAATLRLLRFRRLGRGILVFAILLLWAASTPVAARWAYWMIERQHPPVPVAESPAADVAIVLGGATEPRILPRRDVELNDAADRLIHAADLYRANKVKLILAAGGQTLLTNAPEAEENRAILEKLGVPRAAILVEDRSRNTLGNAAFAAEIWRERGFRSGLLVTSAGHMPRSLQAFRRAGLTLTPSSADVAVALPISRNVLDWLPSARAIELSHRAAHEVLGMLVGRLRDSRGEAAGGG